MASDRAFGYLRNNRFRLLTIGVSVSLLLNVVLLTAWVMFAFRIGGAVDAVDVALERAIADVSEMRDASIEVVVDLDQSISFVADVPIDQVITIPVDTEIMISEQFRTTISVRGPLGTEIPITIDVPLELSVPVVADFEIPISEVVQVDVDVPLVMSVPVELVVADSPIAEFLDNLERSLIELRSALGAR